MRNFLAFSLAAVLLFAASCTQIPAAAPNASPTDIAATVQAAVDATIAAMPPAPTQPPGAVIGTPVVQPTSIAQPPSNEVSIGPIISATEEMATPATAIITDTSQAPVTATPTLIVPITATMVVTITSEPTATEIVSGTPAPILTGTSVPTSTVIPTSTIVPTNTVAPTGTITPTGTVIPPTNAPPSTPTTPGPTSSPGTPQPTPSATTVPTTPPPTPGVPSTPTPGPSTVYMGTNRSYTDGSTMVVVGEVINGSPDTVFGVTVIATFYDNSGGLVGASQAAAYLPATFPTQANPFRVELPNAPATVHSYQLNLRWDEISVASFDRPTIISENVNKDNGIEISGQLRNDHRSELRNIVVAATFYDSSGAVLDVIPGQSTVTTLPSGATTDYNIQSRQAIPFASYLVQSQGVLFR